MTERRDLEIPKNFMIRTDRLPEQGVDFCEVVSGPWVCALLANSDPSHEWSFTQEASVRVQCRPQGEGVIFESSAGTVAEHACIRCLKVVKFPVNFQIDMYLEAGEEKELDLLEENFSVESFLEESEIQSAMQLASRERGYFKNGVVEVATLIREELWLKLPDYPACDHAAASEPASCGQDLLDHSKKDELRFREAKWAGLSNLKNRLPSDS
jgi:uncharacterized metal-binding protein YceD (DUF177 family)